MDLRAPLQLRFQAAPQIRRSHANLLEQRPGHAIDLVEQRDQEMFVRDFLLIMLRGNVLRRLQRFLHLLSEFVRSHVRCSDRTVAPANGAIQLADGAAEAPKDLLLSFLPAGFLIR